MNEYDRLYRQAQRYKELYPKGTRILLLHMGDDPRPVEDDMRGTVMFVDDMVRVKGNGAESLHRKPTGTAAAVAKQGIQICEKYGDSRGDETGSSDR